MVTPKRPPGRPRRADLRMPTEDSIIQSAAALFMDAGYRTVTMDMVADAAGVTKAAVYYHFKDKPALVVAAVRHVLDRARRSTETLLRQDAPLRERFEGIATVVLALPQPFTRFDAMMHEAALDLSSEQIQEIREQEQELGAIIERAVQAEAESEDIQAEDPSLVAHAFLALLRVGQARDAKGDPRFPDAARTAKRLVDIFWAGIGR